VYLTEGEENSLDLKAASMTIKKTLLMRRLVRYILDEKIGFDAMMRAFNELVRREGRIAPRKADGKPFLRVTLNQETELEFRGFAKFWDSSPSSIATSLACLYISEYIERGKIW
jgi:hypothetical protein